MVSRKLFVRIAVIVGCVAMVVFAGWAIAATKVWCGVTCELNQGCGGKALVDLSTGRPAGCSNSNGNCTGNCTLCVDSGNTGYCVYSAENNSTCTAELVASMPCGNKVRGTCGGLWNAGCTCTTTGQNLGACVLNQCAA